MWVFSMVYIAIAASAMHYAERYYRAGQHAQAAVMVIIAAVVAVVAIALLFAEPQS